LIVREFAEETQPGLTLALDTHQSSVINSSFELALKIAATLAHYACLRGIALTLATNSRAFPAPIGPVSRWAAMNYLARVQPDGGPPFAECLQSLRGAPFVAALLPAPDEAAVGPLIELHRSGAAVLAVLFGDRAVSVAALLKGAGLSVRAIGDEPDWERTLAEDERVAVRR
jgi:uncharacterized protein (DUF58 family)